MPIDQAPARCYPSKPDHGCYSCARRRFGDPDPAEHRRDPIIDASLCRIDGDCWMRKPTVHAVPAAVTGLELVWRAVA